MRPGGHFEETKLTSSRGEVQPGGILEQASPAANSDIVSPEGIQGEGIDVPELEEEEYGAAPQANANLLGQVLFHPSFLGAHLHLLKVGVVAIDRLGHS